LDPTFINVKVNTAGQTGFLGGLVFGLVLISAVTLMQIYVFWRAYYVPFIRGHVSGKLLIASGIALWSIFLLGRFIGHDNTGTLAMTLEFLGMNWMAVVFLMTVSMLAVDLITGFGFVLPRLAPFLRGLALAAGAMLSVITLVQGMRPPIVQNYDVDLPALPPEIDGTVLVAMSDLHIGTLISRRRVSPR